MTMREKIARVFAKRGGMSEDANWPLFVDAADAVLDAMREPTPEMQLAVLRLNRSAPKPFLPVTEEYHWAGEIYAAMIDAAKGERMSGLEDERRSDEIAGLEAENTRLRNQIIEQARTIDAQEKLLEKINNIARKIWEIMP